MPACLKKIFSGEVPTSSLVAFRILWGLILALSILRFITKGWVTSLYLEPEFFFSYWGFSWVKPWNQAWMLYTHFGILFLAALGIATGFYYRLSSLVFFIGFTMVELWDKSNYLNHYYFISLMSFLLCWLPLNRAYSLDIAWRKTKAWQTFPKLVLRSIQFQIGLVYFFAGVAKLGPDWLLQGQPLKIWLSTRTDTPILGFLFSYPQTALAMSWLGALFDLSVVFFLLWKKTRGLTYLALLFFHLLTYKLFNIGVFPWVMMVATLVFFDPDWPRRLFSTILTKIKLQSTGQKDLIPAKAWMTENTVMENIRVTKSNDKKLGNYFTLFFCFYFTLQFLFPLRHHFYGGNVLWHEQGFRFSWRVMLMEKTGVVDFILKDPKTKRQWQVSAKDYLKPHQYRQMVTQADMILEMAHYLKNLWLAKGFEDIQVYAYSKVSLNGRPNQTLIDPQVNLAQEKEGLYQKTWIKPWQEASFF
ncbi:MAG: HTTM domain-containing protein [Deltaproteobacteria bacterium]|nr:HTTM domain-containing protein [Deltaproteobacteria bacterium]